MSRQQNLENLIGVAVTSRSHGQSSAVKILDEDQDSARDLVMTERPYDNIEGGAAVSMSRDQMSGKLSGLRRKFSGALSSGIKSGCLNTQSKMSIGQSVSVNQQYSLLSKEDQMVIDMQRKIISKTEPQSIHMAGNIDPKYLEIIKIL